MAQFDNNLSTYNKIHIHMFLLPSRVDNKKIFVDTPPFVTPFIIAMRSSFVSLNLRIKKLI